MKKYIEYSWMIAIIAFNLGAMLQLDLTHENLSYFSVLHQHHILFLWGTLTASWFLYQTYKLFQLSSFSSKAAYSFLFITTTMLILSVLLPYQPERYYVLSELHILLSFVGTLAYAMLMLYYHQQHLRFFYHQIYQKGFVFYLTLMIFDLLQYITYGCVNTYMECSFSIGMSIYLFLLNTAIKSFHQH